MNPRQRHIARVRIAAGVTVVAVVAAVWPPVLWALAALLVYCAALVLVWFGANRLVRRRRPLVVPEPRSNVTAHERASEARYERDVLGIHDGD